MTIQQCINQVSRLNKYTKEYLAVWFFNRNNERLFLFGVDLTKKKVDYFELTCDVLIKESILKIHVLEE